MQLRGELAPLGLAHRESEFILIPDTQTRIYSACGPDALASAATAARQQLVTCAQVYTVMRTRNLCAVSGASTDGGLASAAAALGLIINEHRGYGEPWSGWPTFLGWHLGARADPTVIELANGQALTDELSGLGENATGLQYHFICLIKRHPGGYSAAAGRSLPSGYWACDGDNWAGGNGRSNNFNAADILQFYSDTTLAAARPCAAIAFNRAPTAPQGVSMWTRTPAGAHDDHGHEVGTGVADALFAHGWQTSDGLTGEHYYSTHASVTALDNGHTIIWTGSAIQIDLAAEAIAALTSQISDLQAQQSADQAEDANAAQQLAAAHKAASDAQAQATLGAQQLDAAQKNIAALQEQLAAATAAPKANPLADAAIAALRAALAPAEAAN